MRRVHTGYYGNATPKSAENARRSFIERMEFTARSLS